MIFVIKAKLQKMQFGFLFTFLNCLLKRSESRLLFVRKINLVTIHLLILIVKKEVIKMITSKFLFLRI